MNKYSLSLVLVAGVMVMSTAYAAEDCVKTLMGSQCTVHEAGTSSHMRGNAVANANASKALKQAKKQAREKAVAIGAASKK